MNVQIERQQDATVLRCAGRIVLGHGLERLERVGLREVASGRRVILDLSAVTQVDAQGIGVIARLCRTALVHYRPVVIVGADARVQRMLELTRLDSVLDPVDPRDVHDVKPRHAMFGCGR